MDLDQHIVGLTESMTSPTDLELAPDPSPQPILYPLISVDDHMMEPPDTFDDRIPARYKDKAPRVVEDSAGMQWWQFEDERVPILGGNAVISWTSENKFLGPVRYDQLRPAAYIPAERVKDMDHAGILASLCFPSMVFGFGGQRFMKFKDQGLGLASLRAYNDWILTGWRDAAPRRLIPCQAVWLLDPHVAADDVRMNAALGCNAVTFPENPQLLGLPSIHSDHWDPFLASCEETGTVINLHIGSASSTFKPSTDSPLEVVACLFPVNALASCVDWLYAGVGLRFPNIKIALAESGISWVPFLVDRLDYVESRLVTEGQKGGLGKHWENVTVRPSEVLRRNFWFSTFYDPTAYRVRDVIGINRVMIEVDYPHPDTTWPETQAILKRQFEDLTADEVWSVTLGNAAALYNYELPQEYLSSFDGD